MMSETQQSLQKQLDELRSGIREETRETILRVLRSEEARLEERIKIIKTEGGAVIPGSVTTGGGAFVGRDQTSVGTVVIAQQGVQVFAGEPPVETPAVDGASALGKYLRYVIAQNRYLRLQGIRSGGKLVNIALEEIYVTLQMKPARTEGPEEADWLTSESQMALGERERHLRNRGDTSRVKVEDVLSEHRHLVILGDPGSGKTTLLRYLTLVYARDLAESTDETHKKLGLEEGNYLPILLPLRKIGAFLNAATPDNSGVEGSALLLSFITTALKNESISLPNNFFNRALESGKAAVFLDGLDEVADPDLRRRVARLVEAFVARYPACRYVITSRIVGYEGSARLQGTFETTMVREFAMKDVETFLRNWHRLVAVGQLGPGEAALNFAAQQTEHLVAAIRANERIRDLAINPLLLTVIALVHRDRVKLPDRRAELYAEAVDVLLGKWDEARGVQEIAVLEDLPFDTGDKRLMLQRVALYMHEREMKEIELEDLRRLLLEMFAEILGEQRGVRQAVDRFLTVIEARTGLLVARGEGVYGFSHLTFQEYLAAVAVAGKDGYLQYILARSEETWWQEVILLTAGYLSMISRAKTAQLIHAIADEKDEVELYHNLVLATQCLRDVGRSRVSAALEEKIIGSLDREIARPLPGGKGWMRDLRSMISKGMRAETLIKRRIDLANALSQIGYRNFWGPPYGEPEWVEVPEGDFWMGEEGFAKQVHVDEFRIAKTPVTQAQYQLFVKATGHPPPEDWDEDRFPTEKENHPVVNVSGEDAAAYCQWLSEVTGKQVSLPTEERWEKAARGDRDQRVYPWGDKFNAAYCNTHELGIQDTTPVGMFPQGASPYGVLDLSGNVWEWTNSWYETEQKTRVLRGGSWLIDQDYARCAFRGRHDPRYRDYDIGFRVVVSLAGSES